MMLGNALDFNSNSKANKHGSSVKIVYALFVTLAIFVHSEIADGEFSAVLTLSAVFELLAFCLLGVHVLTTGSYHGISAKSLQLEALALAMRLSSTTWLLGYLPSDASGDFLYQALDILSLLLVLWLLYQMLSARCRTYDSENDELSVGPFVAVCFVLACFLHSDLDELPAFDILWTCGLFLASVAPMPYLWLMAKSREPAPALTSHYVAVMAISRMMSGAYMWESHDEITCEPYFGDFNHAGWAVIAAHVVHLILLADFAYYYLKNLSTGGLVAPMRLPQTINV